MKRSRVMLSLVVIGVLVSFLGIGAIAEPFRAAVIMPSSISDLAFSQSMYDALVAIQEEMGEANFQFVYSRVTVVDSFVD